MHDISLLITVVEVSINWNKEVHFKISLKTGSIELTLLISMYFLVFNCLGDDRASLRLIANEIFFFEIVFHSSQAEELLHIDDCLTNFSGVEEKKSSLEYFSQIEGLLVSLVPSQSFNFVFKSSIIFLYRLITAVCCNI